jgi:alanine racemase
MSSNYLKICSDTLQNNLNIIRTEANGAKVCLPVKANAYGHGIEQIVSIAKDHVDYFAVANLDEALLVNHFCDYKPVLIFGAIDFDNLHKACAHFHFSIQEQSDVQRLNDVCDNRSKKIKVHININTGMNRMGIDFNCFENVISEVVNSKNIDIIGVYSHFACADDLHNPQNTIQSDRFAIIHDFVSKLDGDIICHLSNSYGFVGQSNSTYDMVRVGILSYGYLPSFAVNETVSKIMPIASLTTQISKTMVLKSDFTGVGYSHRYYGVTDEHIAILPIGYGDGFFRSLGGKSHVIIAGSNYPIVGSISMDALAISLGSDDNIKLGDEAIVISSNPADANSARSLARIINTIEYEIITNISSRVFRKIV